MNEPLRGGHQQWEPITPEKLETFRQQLETVSDADVLDFAPWFHGLKGNDPLTYALVAPIWEPREARARGGSDEGQNQ